MVRNVNEKGVVGLSHVVADLVSKGYQVFHPYHDYSPVDLIVADESFDLVRLQIKYREASKGAIKVATRTVVNTRNVPIKKSHIDGWAIYCPTVSKICYVPVGNIRHEGREFTIRTEPAVVVNNWGTKFIDDFLDETKLWSRKTEGRMK